MKRKIAAILLGLGLIIPVAASAEVSDPLLQKLVDKGTISTSEAEEIQSKKTDVPAALKGLSVSGLAFIDYSGGQTGGAAKSNYNKFTLTRGYVTVKKEITPWMTLRSTTDIYTPPTVTTDSSMTVREKYLYADFSTGEFGPITSTGVRTGLIQTPYLEFEESINPYRMQSSMFQDKRGLITSADFGLAAYANLGGKLDKSGTDTVGSANFNGKYGTCYIGVYNGGGYAAAEKNQNKVAQGRLSIRPLPDMLPGLQLTYFGANGEANSTDTASGKYQKYYDNTGLISFQHRYAALSAEYYTGKGSFAGDTTLAKKKNGYSVFGKVTLPMYEKVSLYARYDRLDPNKDASTDVITTTIVGASYRIYKDNYLVAAFEKTHDQSKAQDDKKGQLVLQASF